MSRPAHWHETDYGDVWSDYPRGDHRCPMCVDKKASLSVSERVANTSIEALAEAFSDTVEMVSDGAIPNDVGMEFVVVMEARLAGLGYRIVRSTSPR